MSPLKILFDGKEYFAKETKFDFKEKENTVSLLIEANKNPLLDFKCGMKGALRAIYDDGRIYAYYEFRHVIITSVTKYTRQNKIELTFKKLGKSKGESCSGHSHS